MTYNPITSCLMTRADGTQFEIRRSGLYPNVFTGSDGSVFQVAELSLFLHNGSASVRAANRTTPVKFLVADSWMPGWEEHGESLALHDENPYNCAAANLYPVDRRGRGRPRGGSIHAELQAVEVARILGDIRLASEEMAVSADTMAHLVLKWIPEALLDMEGVPATIMNSAKYRALEKKRK